MTQPEKESTPTSGESVGCSACSKTAIWCQGCPRQNAGHCLDRALLNREELDVVVIAEAAAVPRFRNMNAVQHAIFFDDAGKILRETFRSYGSTREYEKLRVNYTYAVLCEGEDPEKQALDRCSNHLSNSLLNASSAKRTPIILAMGMGPCRALGIKAKKLAEIQSRVLSGVQFAGRTFTVVPTISAKQLASMPGYYPVFQADATRALGLALMSRVEEKPVESLEALTKDYVIPQTLEEVSALVDSVLALPPTTGIALDTETNTKFPHRENTKILAVSMAWAPGKAAAVAIGHKDTPYDGAAALELVKKVLESPHPKLLHNAKYDLKVFRKLGCTVNNLVWDTMLAEHALEEDKKGQYGLKQLTRVSFPEFASYADELHDQQTKLEGDSQLDNIRKNAGTAAVNPLAEAMAVGLSKKGKALKEDKGFEDVELQTLLRYAAIDTDMTKRICLQQTKRFEAEETALRKKKAEEGVGTPPYPIPNLSSARLPAKQAFLSLSLPVLPVLAGMEYEGIRVDREYIGALDSALGEIITKSERELYDIAGGDVKLNSAASVANLLFNQGYVHPTTGERVLHTPVSYTQTGQAQTTEKVLRALSMKSGCLFSTTKLVYSKAYKAKNTFIANVRDLSSLDGFLHTNYNQHGTATYRLSCVAGDTVLETSEGAVRIDALDLNSTPNVTILTHELRQQPILDKIYKGEDEMYEVETDAGHTIKCTAAHRFLTPSGWKRLDALTEGDEILCAESGPTD